MCKIIYSFTHIKVWIILLSYFYNNVNKKSVIYKLNIKYGEKTATNISVEFYQFNKLLYQIQT